MIERLRELADRPIADRHRRCLFAACAALLLGAAPLLLLPNAPRPTSPPSTRTSAERPDSAGAPQAGLRPARSPRDSTRGAARVARRFLRGYLPFLYGQGSAGPIASASPHLLGRLARSRVRVPPAARRRHPWVVELRSARLGAERASVTATVDDGGVSRYPIELTLARRGGGWLVTAVGAD